MYENIKSRVKYDNLLSNDFTCLLGVRKGECLSPFLFCMYVNDLEEMLVSNEFKGIEIGILKLFLLLYADDIKNFSESADGLQRVLDILKDYCYKSGLVINTNKTKIMIFRKGGTIRRGLKFMYDGKEIEIVKKFTYLGVVFTTGGSSFHATHEVLSGQALKAIFKLKAYINKFTNISISHMLALFDKLILPILTYGSEVSGFSKADVIERVHLQFCKHLLGVKIQTQNNFICGELGRVPVRNHRLVSAIRYWFKIVHDDVKYIKLVYNMMLEDFERLPEKLSWAKSVKVLLENLGFGHIWLMQGVGDVTMFLNVFKQRLTDHFIQSWNADISNSSRANTYSLIADFNVPKFVELLQSDNKNVIKNLSVYVYKNFDRRAEFVSR